MDRGAAIFGAVRFVDLSRCVRGILFVDYVRMIRGTKSVDWSRYLEPVDLEIANTRIDPAGWYPMETFERYGVAILAEVGKGQLMAVRM